MAARWRGRSFIEYESSAVPSIVHYACGDQPWQQLCSLVDESALVEGHQQVFLCSLTNLSAVREAVVAWWRQLPQNHSGSPGEKQPRLLLRPLRAAVTQSPTKVRNSEDSCSVLRKASADEILCALLLYQLMQQTELELGEDNATTRALLSEVVTDAAARSNDATGDDGSYVLNLLYNAVMLERGVGIDDKEACHHNKMSRQLPVLDFDRHSVAPVLIRAVQVQNAPNYFVFGATGTASLRDNDGHDLTSRL